MIVPMKCVTVLCFGADRDASLSALRELGVLHLSPFQETEGADVEKERERLGGIQRALLQLPSSTAGTTGGELSIDAVVAEVDDLTHRRSALDAEQLRLQREIERTLPFGQFDPAQIQALAREGVHLKLLSIPKGKSFEAPDSAAVVELGEGKDARRAAVVSQAPVDAGGLEFHPPAHGIGEMQSALESIASQRTACDTRLADLAARRAQLERALVVAEEKIAFLEARTGMGDSGVVGYVRGYCPEDCATRVAEASAQHGWAVVIDDPKPGDPVPTMMKNTWWVRPIKAVFDAIGILPGYEEIDISAVFMLFFSVFFAMLVGDAGYGALFLIMTIVARRRFRDAPPAPFVLLYVMSIATMVWGVLTGTYFGLSNLPAPLRELKIDWLGNERNIMLLCFVIGALHLSVAHAWNAWRSRTTLQALAQLGWIGTTWTMYFIARTMVLGEAYPAVVTWVFALSVIAIVLFMTPVNLLKHEWFNHVMLPLSLVSNFVDVVSYLRLFAVGTASFAVAASFNDMALAGVKGLGTGLIAALILFFGHALNILLSAMGVLVHGVRLNTLEFSSHIGMQWTGFPYRPFQKNENRRH